MKRNNRPTPYLPITALSLLMATSCVLPEDTYNNSGNYGGYGHPGYYDGYYGSPDRRYGRRDNDYHHHHHDHSQDEERHSEHQKDEAPLPPPPKPPQTIIRPSCPSGTTFNGKHCIIPENQRRKGGKGTINPCPKGMWVSGDQCVGP